MTTSFQNSLRSLCEEFSLDHINISSPERAASVIGGSLIALWGLSRRSLSGLAIAALGGMLVLRGKSGHCSLYEALGIDRSDERESVNELSGL
ncbi:MAG: DUF2892 domain-containing protein [Armatimonadetes bacterium]|nr:DUF2892 domain-containing protein [Armatimonadota bacterium]